MSNSYVVLKGSDDLEFSALISPLNEMDDVHYLVNLREDFDLLGDSPENTILAEEAYVMGYAFPDKGEYVQADYPIQTSVRLDLNDKSLGDFMFETGASNEMDAEIAMVDHFKEQGVDLEVIGSEVVEEFEIDLSELNMGGLELDLGENADALADEPNVAPSSPESDVSPDLSL